jgi:hypothetical protein
MSDATKKMGEELQAQKEAFEDQMRKMFEFRMMNVLREREHVLKCEVCGAQMKFNNAPIIHIMVEEEAFHHLMESKFGQLGQLGSIFGNVFGNTMSRGKEVQIPALMVICYECGNLRNHSLKILGVEWETMAQEIANDITGDGTAIEALQKSGPIGIVNTPQDPETRRRILEEAGLDGIGSDRASAEVRDAETEESLGDTNGDET